MCLHGLLTSLNMKEDGEKGENLWSIQSNLIILYFFLDVLSCVISINLYFTFFFLSKIVFMRMIRMWSLFLIYFCNLKGFKIMRYKMFLFSTMLYHIEKKMLWFFDEIMRKVDSYIWMQSIQRTIERMKIENDIAYQVAV